VEHQAQVVVQANQEALEHLVKLGHQAHQVNQEVLVLQAVLEQVVVQVLVDGEHQERVVALVVQEHQVALEHLSMV